MVVLFVDDCGWFVRSLPRFLGTGDPGCERKKTLVGDIKPPITVPGDEFATNLQSAEHMWLGVFWAIFETRKI